MTSQKFSGNFVHFEACLKITFYRESSDTFVQKYLHPRHVEWFMQLEYEIKLYTSVRTSGDCPWCWMADGEIQAVVRRDLWVTLHHCKNVFRLWVSTSCTRVEISAQGDHQITLIKTLTKSFVLIEFLRIYINVGRDGSRIPRRMGRQPSRGAPTYDFVKISEKLHEIEIFVGGRGKRPSPL